MRVLNQFRVSGFRFRGFSFAVLSSWTGSATGTRNGEPELRTRTNPERGTQNLEPRGEYAKGPALPCGEVEWTCVSRWNRSGAALQASSHRGMHTTRRCDSLRLNVGPIEPPKPSRAKQGTQFPVVILVPSGLGGKRRVEEAFEGFSALGEGAAASFLDVLAAEQFVCDVQRRQHRKPYRVARGRRFGGCPYFFVHVRCEHVDVARVEFAADGITLSANLHRHDVRLRHVVLQAQSFELFQHVRDAAANRLALHSQRGDLGETSLRLGDSGSSRLEVARQSRDLLGGARLVGLQPADHRDEHFHFLFQTVDGFQIDRAGGCSTGHWGTSAGFVVLRHPRSLSLYCVVRIFQRS